MIYKPHLSLLLITLVALIPSNDKAATSSLPEFRLIIESHFFVPDVIVIPQHQVTKLIFINRDDEAEEIVSYSLNIQKIIHGHSQGFAIVGPLEQGDYALQGRFFPRTAIGIVRVRDSKVWKSGCALIDLHEGGTN